MSIVMRERRSWREIVKAWADPRVVTMLFLGFSAGIPILLIFSTLSVWLREAGVSRAAVTFFSWAALGYSFKFVWAPLVDMVPFPLLTRLMGRRRSWLLIAQLAIMAAIMMMASIDPAQGDSSLHLMAFAAVLLGFSSATQDIVIDAYRIECIDETYQALLSSMYIAGYRIGMVLAGAGSLFLASFFGTTTEMYLYQAWRSTYYIMAAVMLVGVVTTIIMAEPRRNRDATIYSFSNTQYFKFFTVFFVGCIVFSASFFITGSVAAELKIMTVKSILGDANLIGFVVEASRLVFAVIAAGVIIYIIVISGYLEKKLVVVTYVEPMKDFFSRYGMKAALLLLLLIGFYRISDIVLGVVSNVFYVDMGFSKNVIAGITKLYGVGMTILGGFLGGVLTLRYGVYAILFVGALLSAATNLLFMLLAGSGADVSLLTAVIAIDNLSGGLAATAFVAFLSSLTNISFTAVQYALFSSLMTLFPKLFGGYSGTIVNSYGYNKFFLITALMGFPVLVLIWLVKRTLASAESKA